MRLSDALASRRTVVSPRLALIVVVLVTIVPGLFLAGWMGSQSANLERTQIEQYLQETARELAGSVGHEVERTRNLLVMLTTSHLLMSGDIDAFQERSRQISREFNVHIVLRDPYEDKQIFNTAAPPGTSLVKVMSPPIRMAAEREVLRSRQPMISDAFNAPLMQEPTISIIAPVLFGQDLRYILSIGIPGSNYERFFPRPHLQYQAVVAIADGNGIVLARSRQQEFLGKPLHVTPPAVPDASARGLRLNRTDGIVMAWAMQRVALTNWSVNVGVPAAVLDAPFNRTISTVMVAGSALLVLALTAAFFVGGHIAKTAGALGIDRSPTGKEFELLFQSAPYGVLVVDRKGHIVLINIGMEQMFGYARSELVGAPVYTIVPERFRPRFEELRREWEARAQGGPFAPGADLFGRRKDGSEFPIEVQLSPINTPGGILVLSAVTDISERRQAAKQLSHAIKERDEMRRRFLQAQERERLRLAHELHDQSGQSLAAAMVELKFIEDLVDDNGRQRVRRLRGQLDEMGRALHHVAWELRPPSIDELGLASAIATYAADWSEQFGIECDIHCADSRIDELPDEVRTTVYRVIQEALTNVAKHARSATSVSVIIERIGSVLRLTIEDNGEGFPDAATDAPSHRGLGLAGMRERVSLIGGEFNAESTQGVGTTIFVRIPIEQVRAAE